MDIRKTVLAAAEKKTAILAFNIPYLPMVEPVAKAIADEKITALIHTARIEWEKFAVKSLEHVAAEYKKHEKPGFTVLGLDHVPVIDEDNKKVDYMAIIKRALNAGYESIMIDGSRLDLDGNIAATREAADAAHSAGAACEGELGAVMGHESSPTMPYEEIFTGRVGFTDTEEAKRFALESGCDWLSIAAGNIHGAVAEAIRHLQKPAARLDIEHIAALYHATGLPLVLHGGTGIPYEYIHRAIAAGIAKINIATEIRQVYEKSIQENAKDIARAQDKVYSRVREMVNYAVLRN